MSMQGGSEKITLEDVVFKYLMDLSQLAGKIRTSTDIGYQKNVDNYYFSIMTLYNLLGDYIDPATENKRIKLLVDAKKKYLAIQGKDNENKHLVKARRDEVVSLTFNVATSTLNLTTTCLSKKGILRERTSSVVAGSGQLREDEDMEHELNAPDPEKADDSNFSSLDDEDT